MDLKAAGLVLGILLQDLRRHLLQLLVTLGSMAAGVAVIVAIYLAGAAARSSFRSSFAAVAGKATHQIAAPTGISEERLAVFKSLPGVQAAQPVVEGLVPVVGMVGGDSISFADRPLPPLRLLGIDPFQLSPFIQGGARQSPLSGADLEAFVGTPNAVLLPETWARETGLKAENRVRIAAGGYSADLQVLGLYAPERFGG